MSKRSVHIRRRISRDWYQDKIHNQSEHGEYKGAILNLSYSEWVSQEYDNIAYIKEMLEGLK